MFARIAYCCRYGFEGFGTRCDKRRRRDDQGTQARGQKIHRRIETRRIAAEIEIAFVAVGDHRIERVSGLVGHQARQAEQHVPEARGHDRVGEILGERFNTRPRDTVRVEAFGISPDDARHGQAPAGKPAFVETVRDGYDMVVERALGDEHRHDQNFDGGTPRVAPRIEQHEPAESCGKPHHQHDCKPAAHAARARAALRTVEARFKCCDQSTQPLHRMADPRENRAHFAHHGIGGKGRQQDQQRIDKTRARQNRHAGHLGRCGRENQSTRSIK